MTQTQLLAPISSLLASYRRQFGLALRLPEERELEMYSGKRRTLPAGANADSLPVHSEARIDERLLPWLDGPWQLLHLLEASFALAPDGQLEGTSSWQRYLSLPRRNLSEKLVAESYRLLRIVRVALLHPQGQVKGRWTREGAPELIRLGCHANAYPLQLGITPVGLQLLQSLLLYYLQERDAKQVGPAYLEAMLQSYFTDLVGELRGFEDEDRALCQFRPGIGLNRHWRLVCHNPRYRVEEGYCLLQLGPRFAEGGSHPIDFILRLNDTLYRVPMEALVARPGSQETLRHAIALQALAGWQIQAGDAGADLHSSSSSLLHTKEI